MLRPARTVALTLMLARRWRRAGISPVSQLEVCGATDGRVCCGRGAFWSGRRTAGTTCGRACVRCIFKECQIVVELVGSLTFPMNLDLLKRLQMSVLRLSAPSHLLLALEIAPHHANLIPVRLCIPARALLLSNPGFVPGEFWRVYGTRLLLTHLDSFMFSLLLYSWGSILFCNLCKTSNVLEIPGAVTCSGSCHCSESDGFAAARWNGVVPRHIGLAHGQDRAHRLRIAVPSA